MEIMNLPRGCGKTTNIIIEAVKTGCPIITLCRTMKRDIERRAEKITNLSNRQGMLKKTTDKAMVNRLCC